MIGIDTEYVAHNAVQGDIPGPRPNPQSVYCEIMQIGACKLDGQGQEVGTLNLTVRAHILSRIPKWLTTLTGMTEEKRSLGISFPEALKELVSFIGDDDDIWTFGGDWWVFEANMKAHDLVSPFAGPFQRLKPILDEHDLTLERFKSEGFSEVCSGGLYKVLGLQLPTIEGVGAHDAAHDARSLIHAVHHLDVSRAD